MSFYIDKITKNTNLKNFLHMHESLKSTYAIKRDQLSPEWIHFNSAISSSLNSLYAFSIDLYSEANFEYKDSRFYSFYYDFIVSKPSNTIFTETNKNTEVDIFPRTAKKIATLAEDLLEYAKNKKTKKLYYDNNFNKLYQEFFHNAFAYYDFTFYGDSGIFSSYIYDAKLFKKQKNIFLDILENEVLTTLLNKAIIINIDIATKHCLDNKTSNILEEYNYAEIYKKYVEYNSKHKYDKNKVIKLEFFTYILMNKLWKIEKIYQKTPEFISEELTSYQKTYSEEITRYITKYFDLIEQFYNNELILDNLYLKISNLDKTFIQDYIFNNLLADINNDNALDNLNETLNTINLAEEKDIWDKEQKSDTESINAAINTIIINNNPKIHEKFKFYRILAKGTTAQIDPIIDAMHQMIKNKYEFNGDIYYMGILRSGSFLAHTLNILKYYESKKLLPSSAILTHPFLTILPRIIFKRAEGEDHLEVLYIDEAIKSAYSLNISELYRERFLKLKGNFSKNKDSAITLTNFKDYKIKKSAIEYTSLTSVKLNNESNKLEVVEFKKQSLKPFKWNKFINTLKIPNLQEEIKNFSKITIENQNRFDFTKTISHSIYLFAICKVFALKLIDLLESDSLKGKKHIIFYTGSIEGKLLIDLTIFIYKHLSIDNSNLENKKIYIEGKTITFDEVAKIQDTSLTCFFDLSIITGTTKRKVFDLDLKSKFINYSKNDFNHSFVIYNSSSDISNDVTTII